MITLKKRVCQSTTWSALGLAFILAGVYVGTQVTIRGRKPQEKVKKPFGLGKGPGFIGGRNIDSTGTDLVVGIYSQYVNYRFLTSQTDEDEQEYYQKWNSQEKCDGLGSSWGCPENTYCKKGMCFCDGSNSYSQLYGQCWLKSSWTNAFSNPEKNMYWNQTLVKWVTDSIEGSYCNRSNLQQSCRGRRIGRGIYRSPDINMVCGEDGTCKCRTHTKWHNDECELFLDVSCYDVGPNITENKIEVEITEMLKGEKELNGENDYSFSTVTGVFCRLLESLSKEYIGYMRAEEWEYRLYGMNWIGVVIFCVGCLILFIGSISWLTTLKEYCRIMCCSAKDSVEEEEEEMEEMCDIDEASNEPAPTSPQYVPGYPIFAGPGSRLAG